MNTSTPNTAAPSPILVIGASGKTGRRVVERLEAKGQPVRRGSRSAEIPFDWHDPSTWGPAVQGAGGVYLTYYPDLTVPGAVETVEAFTKFAVERGVSRLVLLSGRGEAEAQRCEEIVAAAGVSWTVVRAGWFNQNFSEGAFLDLVLSGTVALPVGGVREAFIDCDDIADVAVAALTEAGHDGEIYEVTGPSLITFDQAVKAIADAAGVQAQFIEITPEQFEAGLVEQGVPADYVRLLNYLFNEVLDGRNEYVGDGVQRALGREPRAFEAYAQDAASNGAWSQAVAS